MHSLKNKTKNELIAELERLRSTENTMNHLEDSSFFLRQIIQKIPGTFISVFNKALKLVFTSEHELASPDKSSKTFLQQSPEEIYGTFGSMIAKKLSKALKGEDEHFELFISGKYFNYKTTPIPDASGLISNVALIATDITSNKNATLALDESEDKFKTLYNYGPLCYQSLKKDGTLKDVNPTWLSTLGYDRDEVIGTYFGDFLHPSWKVSFENNFGKFKMQGFIHNVEFKIRHKNGDYKHIALEGCAGYHSDGRFKQTYCVFQDITERKQAEDNFKETNTLNKAIIANVHEGIVVYDTSLIIKLWNPFMETLTSYPASLVLNKTPEQAFTPTVQNELLAKLKRTLEEQKTYTSIFKYKHKQSGEYLWLSDQSSPLKNDAGDIIGIIGVIKDITQKIEAENAIRASEQKFSTIFELSPIPASLAKMSDGTYTQVNLAFCKFFEYAKREILGRTAIDLEILDTEASKRIEQKLKTKHVARDFEIKIKTKSGGKKDVLISIKIVSIGGEDYALNMIVDISEQKKILTELRKRNQFIETVINTMPIGFAANKLVNGEQVYLNKQFEEIYGWPRPDSPNANFIFENAFPEKTDLQHIKDQFFSNITSKNPQSIAWNDLKIKTEQGETKYINVTTVPLPDQQLMISTLQDVTKGKLAEKELFKYQSHLEELVSDRTKALAEKTLKLEKSQRALTYLLEDVNAIRKQLEQSNTKLLQANEELESFSYSVSHDLRAPLRAINGYSKILMEDYIHELDDEAKRLFSVIINNTENMRQLIDDILALSRLGRKERIIHTIHTTQLVQNIIVDVQAQEKDRDIVFQIDNLPNIIGDQGMIKQLFINLISNAVKFTRNKSRAHIHIGTKVEKHQTVFFVKDNGAGFDMKYVAKIFEVFQRLHTVEQFEGTGIGLALVKSIIKKHDGKIWAESETDIGTTIFFELKHE